jgi:hypothetical protein
MTALLALGVTGQTIPTGRVNLISLPSSRIRKEEKAAMISKKAGGFNRKRTFVPNPTGRIA